MLLGLAEQGVQHGCVPHPNTCQVTWLLRLFLIPFLANSKASSFLDVSWLLMISPCIMARQCNDLQGGLQVVSSASG